MRGYIRKRKTIIVIGVIILTIILSGITYAYLKVDKVQEDKNIVSFLKCLSVSIIDNGGINIEDAFPIEDDYAKLHTESYDFKIKNNCPINISADINLYTLRTENGIEKKFVRAYLLNEETSEENIKNLGYNEQYPTKEIYEEIDLNSVDPNLINAYYINSGNKLTTTNIEVGKTKNYKLKLWLDYDTTWEEGSNKTYEGKIVISASPKPTEPKIYGVMRSIESSLITWDRTDEAVGLSAIAEKGNNEYNSDFDKIYPWSEIETYALNISTGEEISLTEVGTENFPWTGGSNNEYEIFTRIPEFYYKREQKANPNDNNKIYEYVQISNAYQEGFTKSEAFSLGRYTMSGTANNVHSRSGATPMVSTTIADFRTYATNLGNEFGQLDYRYLIIQLLYLVEYANYDSQTVLGSGITNASAAVESGHCNSLLMESGTCPNADKTVNATDGKHSVIYRGIENIFGNVWQFVDGINIVDRVAYVCESNNQRADYKVDITNGCYEAVGYTNASSNGYIKTLGYDPNHSLYSFPTATGGSTSTYIPDYYWSAIGNNIALVGGRWGGGTGSGLWGWSLGGDSSGTDASVGARLLRTK